MITTIVREVLKFGLYGGNAFVTDPVLVSWWIIYLLLSKFCMSHFSIIIIIELIFVHITVKGIQKTSIPPDEL